MKIVNTVRHRYMCGVYINTTFIFTHICIYIDRWIDTYTHTYVCMYIYILSIYTYV